MISLLFHIFFLILSNPVPFLIILLCLLLKMMPLIFQKHLLPEASVSFSPIEARHCLQVI